ncbi:MAG: PssE/Cps14G family polysaccharide biosynthesis glycosyltransferase [Gammaproteobacteria bacterium]
MLSLPDVSNKQRILVITGTTGFDSLVRSIDEDRDLELQYDFVLQTGDGSYRPKHKKYFAFDKNLKDTLDQYNFFVTHAGAGSIFMLLEQKKRVLVVPNTERADKHQIELAQYVQAQRLCAVCFDVSQVTQAIREIERRTQYLQPYEKVEFNAVKDVLRYIYE